MLYPWALGRERASSDRCYRFPNHKYWEKMAIDPLYFLATAVNFFTSKLCDGSSSSLSSWSLSMSPTPLKPSYLPSRSRGKTLRSMRPLIDFPGGLDSSSNPGFRDPRPYVATRRAICLHSQIDRLTSMCPIFAFVSCPLLFYTLATLSHTRVLLTRVISEARVSS